jgi:hypothetical protein
MLEQLIRLTASPEYLERGSMRVKEVLIRPWEGVPIKIILDVYFENDQSLAIQTWELICKDIMYNTSNKVHEPKIPQTQIKLYSEHPILWNYDDETFYSVKGTSANISELMGDLFIANSNASGNWVAFDDLFWSLPKTLETQRKNQLAMPNQLCEPCFEVFKKHKIEYVINSVQKGQREGLNVLFFSRPQNWPDNESFGQPYLVAKEFGERSLGHRTEEYEQNI